MANTEPLQIPLSAIPFQDRKGRRRYAVVSSDRTDYRILDDRGHYLWNASIALVRNIDDVELPRPDKT